MPLANRRLESLARVVPPVMARIWLAERPSRVQGPQVHCPTSTAEPLSVSGSPSEMLAAMLMVTHTAEQLRELAVWMAAFSELKSLAVMVCMATLGVGAEPPLLVPELLPRLTPPLEPDEPLPPLLLLPDPALPSPCVVVVVGTSSTVTPLLLPPEPELLLPLPLLLLPVVVAEPLPPLLLVLLLPLPVVVADPAELPLLLLLLSLLPALPVFTVVVPVLTLLPPVPPACLRSAATSTAQEGSAAAAGPAEHVRPRPIGPRPAPRQGVMGVIRAGLGRRRGGASRRPPGIQVLIFFYASQTRHSRCASALIGPSTALSASRRHSRRPPRRHILLAAVRGGPGA